MSSTTGTPQPARSGFKLKLNGRGANANGTQSSRTGTESAALSEGEDD